MAAQVKVHERGLGLLLDWTPALYVTKAPLKAPYAR